MVPINIFPFPRAYVIYVLSQHCWQMTSKYSFVVEMCLLKQFLYLWCGIPCKTYSVFTWNTKAGQSPIIYKASEWSCSSLAHDLDPSVVASSFLCSVCCKVTQSNPKKRKHKTFPPSAIILKSLHRQWGWTEGRILSSVNVNQQLLEKQWQNCT